MSTTTSDDKQKTLVLLGSILAVLGLGLSLYTLYHHIELKFFGDHSFVCNINDVLSCDDVASSRYAEDPWGNPLGIYGAGYFLGLLALLIVSRFKEAFRSETLQTYAGLVVLGVLVSLGLGTLSKVAIGKLCPTCMVIYAVTVFQGLVLYFCRDGLPRPFELKKLSNGVWYPVLTLAVSIAIFQMLKPGPSHDFKFDLPKDGAELEAIRQELASEGQGPSPLASLESKISESVHIDASAYSGLGEDFRKGSDDAKVKIVEYADFQCPACSNASQAMRQMAEEFGGKILVVFKNFPLDNSCNPTMERAMHPFSCKAAILARCAGANGKFWELHNRLYDQQSSIDETRLIAWSKDVGLNDAQIQSCLSSKDIVSKIQDDIKQASAAGLTGTPTIFFNGRRYNGPIDANEIRKVIKAMLES